MTMDAIELLIDDHRKVDNLFAEFKAAEPDARQKVVWTIVRELAIHAAIEETVFYPALREDVPGSDPLVAHSLDEHKDIKEVLTRVDDLAGKAHTKECEAQVRRLEKTVAHHVTEEEREVLPAARQALTQARLDELATKMRKARGMAPTHPHPSAPDEGMAAELSGKAAGFIDRVRDAISGRA